MADAIVTFRRGTRTSPWSSSRPIEPPVHRSAPDGRADLAWITLGQALPGIQQRPVIDLPWVLAVHAGDPLAERDSSTPAT